MVVPPKRSVSAKSRTIRLAILSFCFCLAALALVLRLYMVQIVRGEEFAERADRQYVRPQSLFDRGSIFFTSRDGKRVAAATLASGFAIAISPDAIVDPEATFSRLVSVLPELSRDEFLSRTSLRGDPYERIAERLTEGEAAAIRAMKLSGVSIERDRWRIYPGGTSTAHALGFVGFEGDRRTGRYGLERYYEDVLRRSEGARAVNFFAELFAGASTALRGAEHARGNLELTIEPSVEAALTSALGSVRERWSAVGAGGIILDPKTGAVVAMAAEPTFNPNYFTEADPAAFANPLVEHVFEMGSIVKPLTLAAGLDADIITPESMYYDSGSLTLDTWTISNFDGKGRGRVSMQTVLNESLNTGAAYVASQLGSARFAEYFRRYGLGEETGIDVPNETRGLLGNLESPRSIEYATASFGQGIALTPIGTARALASLANGGFLVTPHVVARVATDLGVARNAPAAYPSERILSAKAAEEITRMLVRVVDEALVGGAARLPHYAIAAKTGTAQVANSEDGGYYEDKFLHAFFGYFPAYDPRFLIFLYMREPQGIRYASQTLTTPFMDLAKFLIGYYEIPPDR